MKGKTLVAGGFLSVALLSSSINGIPQAAAMEDAPIPTTQAATCAVSNQAASAEVSLNEIARPSTSASLGNLSISAVSTLSKPNMTNNALPMHTKRDCHRAYERDSKRCRKAPGPPPARAQPGGAVLTFYVEFLAGAKGKTKVPDLTHFAEISTDISATWILGGSSKVNAKSIRSPWN